MILIESLANGPKEACGLARTARSQPAWPGHIVVRPRSTAPRRPSPAAHMLRPCPRGGQCTHNTRCWCLERELGAGAMWPAVVRWVTSDLRDEHQRGTTHPPGKAMKTSLHQKGTTVWRGRFTGDLEVVQRQRSTERSKRAPGAPAQLRRPQEPTTT
jgi:hypothetical protein